MKTLNNHWLSLFLGPWPLLEASWRPLGASWRRLGAAAATDAAFDAAAAGSKLSWWLEASCNRFGGVLDPLEGLLEPEKTS